MDTKEKIFEAAMVVFIDKGYAGATMDQVMEVAGTSKGSLYYHFESKHDLFVDLFDFWFAKLASEYSEIFSTQGTPWQKLRQAVLSSFEMFSKNEDVFKAFMEFFNMGMKDEVFKKKIADYYHQMTWLFIDVVKEGVEVGQFEVEDLEDSVMFMFSLLDGLALRILISSVNVDEHVDEDVLLAFVARMFGYKGEL